MSSRNGKIGGGVGEEQKRRGSSAALPPSLKLRRTGRLPQNDRSGGARKAPAMPPLEQILKGRRILLTGATGFLGKVFLYVLLRSHPEIGRIYLLIRGDQRSAASRFRREILDSPVFGRLREDLGDSFTKLVEQKIAILPGDITLGNLIADDASGHAPANLDAVVHCA